MRPSHVPTLPALCARTGAMLWLAASAAVCAQTGGAPPARAPAVKALTGNAKAGQTLMTAGVPPAVAACTSCHGQKAEGAGAFPPLTGSGAAYLLAQLDAFADGSRANAIMAPIAKGLSPQQRADVSTYLASLPSGIVRPAAPPADARPGDAGAWLAQRGRMANGVPACASCHGPQAHGTALLPRLAGQNARYLSGQLQDFNLRQRTNDNAVMHDIASKLSPADIQAVTNYLTQLP